MKEIEITTYVYNTIEEVDEILKKQGFKIIRKTKLKDKYFTLRFSELNKDNILEILSSCVLLTDITCDDIEYKLLTYKDKKYQGNTVLSEEKIKVHIEELNEMEKLLEKVGFKNIVNINDDMIVYGNGTVEFGIQQVEGLGILLEYENPNDFSNVINEEIIKEKKKMLEEIRKYKLDVSDDYDVKKAYELIKNNNYL